MHARRIRNLVLSENAVINTKPQLEIHADDVKCSHGSTVGQLDRDSLCICGREESAQQRPRVSCAMPLPARSSAGSRSLPCGLLDDYLLMKFGSSRYRESPRKSLTKLSPADRWQKHWTSANPGRFSDSEAEDPRQALGIPRQRGHQSKTTECYRRVESLLQLEIRIFIGVSTT